MGNVLLFVLVRLAQQQTRNTRLDPPVLPCQQKLPKSHMTADLISHHWPDKAIHRQRPRRHRFTNACFCDGASMMSGATFQFTAAYKFRACILRPRSPDCPCHYHVACECLDLSIRWLVLSFHFELSLQAYVTHSQLARCNGLVPLFRCKDM